VKHYFTLLWCHNQTN